MIEDNHENSLQRWQQRQHHYLLIWCIMLHSLLVRIVGLSVGTVSEDVHGWILKIKLT